MENIQFTRKELYDLIWIEQIQSIAKRLNINVNELKKPVKR